MGRIARVSTVAILVLVAACAHRPAPADGERARLERRQAEFFAAMAARDADRMAGMFTEDAVLHVANMPPVAGRPAIAQFYRTLFGFLSATRASPETLHIAGGGDMAWGTGAATNTFRGPDGTAEYTGKYVLVWHRVGGDWAVALYGVSSNQPDAGR